MTFRQIDAMRRSVADLARLASSAPEEVLEGLSDHLAGLVGEGAMSFDQSGDLGISEAAGDTAGRAHNVERLKLNPADRYLELFAALAAAHPDNNTVISHGWPLLLESGSTSMTEGGAESICAPEGVA